MKKICLGGYGMLTSHKRIQFQNFINPNQLDINEIVYETIKYPMGVIEINIDPEPHIGIFNLTVEFDSGNYLPLLGVYLDDGDVDVKNLIDYKKSGQVIIGGYYYPAEFTTNSLEIIKNLLVNFSENTNVLNGIMK